MQGAAVPRGMNATGYTGTISFAAPEIVRRQNNGLLGNFTVKSDVFSLGMIVYFMCFGELPYHHANLEEDEKEDVDGLKDEVSGWEGLRHKRADRQDLPEKLYENLQLLLSQDPDQRPSTDEILRSIRTGSSFSEYTSPVKDRFPSPDFPTPGKRNKSVDYFGSNGWTESTKSSSTLDHSPRSPINGHGDALQVRRRTKGEADTSIAPISSPPMLMAPPTPRRSTLSRAFPTSHASVIRFLQLFTFAVKIWTLTASCQPYQPRREIQYPLLAVAAINLTHFGRNLPATVLLVLLHGGVLLWAQYTHVICEA